MIGIGSFVRSGDRRVAGIVAGIPRVHRAVRAGPDISVGVRLRSDDRGAWCVSGCRGPNILRMICVDLLVSIGDRRINGVVDGVRSARGCCGPSILRTIRVDPLVRAGDRRVSGLIDSISGRNRLVGIGLSISIWIGPSISVGIGLSLSV